MQEEPATPAFIQVKKRFEQEEPVEVNINKERRMTEIFRKEVSPQRNSILQDMNVRISLCENLIHNKMTSEEIQKIFDEKEVGEQQFLNNPKEMLEKNLMIKIQDKIYDKKIGFPQLISLIVFQQTLKKQSLHNILFDKRLLLDTVTVQSQIPPKEFWHFI